MAIKHSVAVRNAMLQAVETAIGASPKLRIYSGALPANCAAAVTGTQLAELTLPADWMAAPSDGVALKAGVWTTASITTSGTASHYRIYDSTGATCHEQGTCRAFFSKVLTASTPANSAIITVATTANLIAGQLVSGDGISAGSGVSQIVDATQFRLQKVSIPGIANGTTIYFVPSITADLGLPTLAMVAGQPLTIDYRALIAPGA